MPSKSIWRGPALSEFEVVAKYGLDASAMIRKKAYRAGEWVDEEMGAGTWVVLRGRCRVAMFSRPEDRPRTESEFWSGPGWTLEPGDQMDFSPTRFLLTVLDGESEVEIMTVYRLPFAAS